MVFQYHGDQLESKVEGITESQEEDDKGNDEVEEDGLSEVGSYVTAEDSEVDVRMDLDGVDLVHEELGPCQEQVYQPSLELANLYEPYSDREDIRYVDGSTDECDDADVGVDLSSGNLHIDLTLSFHAY